MTRETRNLLRIVGVALVGAWLGLSAVGCSGSGSSSDSGAEGGVMADGVGGADGAGGDAQYAFLNHSPEAEYVGRDSCRGCHVQIHTTFVKNGMGRAFHAADASIAVEDWSGEPVVRTAGDVGYRMFERDGRYYQRQYIEGPNGEERNAVEHELIYAIGSNNHNRGYTIEVEGKWFQAPVCWYPQAEKWDVCPGFERKNDHFSREVSDSCVYCHNGVMQLAEGERNVYLEPIADGIGCERCHGPGSMHVEKWTSGDAVAGGAGDPTIVNPRRLEHEARMAVCHQCHMGDARASERVTRYNKSQRDFRPGMEFTEIVMPFRYVQHTRHDFSISAQADRLMISECYLQSNGALDCLTCHNPHESIYDRTDESHNAKCQSCHALDDCIEEPAVREAAADSCISCHMRTAEPDDQRMTEFTDHWIRRRIDDDVRDNRTNRNLEPFFPEAFQAMSEGEQAWVEGRAYFLLGNEATPSWRPEMYGKAEERFRTAIASGLDSDQTWFFLGKTILQQGRPVEAVEAFTKAVAHGTGHRDAAYSLAQTLNALNRVDEAEVVLREMLERDGNDALALAEFGLVSWKQERYGEALAAYERAAKVEPWNSMIQTNLAMTLSAVGRYDDAAWISERVAQLDPDDPRTWNLYANVMREAGRAEDAEWGQNRLLRTTQR